MDSDTMVKEILANVPKDNWRLRDEATRLGRILHASDLSIREQMEAVANLVDIHKRTVPAPSKTLRQATKPALKVVGKMAPKLGAVMGGPLGVAVAAGSTLLDMKDAYSMGEATMNPKTEEDRVRQKHLADLMRRGID